jgi:hypothetical protein
MVEGAGCVVERVHLKHSNIAGLFVVGSNHTLRELLVENVDWMGSLDFPAIQVQYTVFSIQYLVHSIL